MSIVMDMSSYEIERDAKETGYGENAMLLGWNPVPALRQQSQFTSPDNTMPCTIAMTDAESFLRRMCARQR